MRGDAPAPAGVSLDDMCRACTATTRSAPEKQRPLAQLHFAGSSCVYKTSPIERALRDAETLRHHGLTAEGRLVNAAQAYWGCDIDFPFLAMD